ncbi:demethylmenaquinone methyltransferase [Tessaracoccus sp. ZS01]|uniref:demethylmenaquinone methyltransferase n=1 Tax=Tessaracoccus sp. ZS01 TaxID=1906324 RepID=UPI00096C3FAC|nr:demethylmenaquinone methyltransferase [Tessaracoccus sp. ZS01]MCG6567297.1 demethylmenaquinone methyltransferase [Tessaracoccus sp. ZS01]OMG57254.1 bifunctional demethylmenaquinone methyltransferase/2-methoxy-6-polyprenyl-1,4-benzoquinol methylase [Tessaracoccus sp. ZS01]
MQSEPGSRATLDKRRGDVAAMFDGVAKRYDLFNDVLSMGQVRRWRRATVEAVDPQPGQRILDLAAGTGTSSAVLAAHGAYVVPSDISLGMLAQGRRQQPGLDFVAGDAVALPFPDDTFDAVTISYGLRNVERTLDALKEMYRVTKPGGRVVIAEFSTPTNRAFRHVYTNYLVAALPRIAKLSSNPVAYGYLAESILAWPDQQGLADLMREAGWQGVEWQDHAAGIVALHRGWKR